MAAIASSSSFPHLMRASNDHLSFVANNIKRSSVEEGRPSSNKRGRVKNVSWLPDSQICQVRQFLSADAPTKLGPIEHTILCPNNARGPKLLDLPPGFAAHLAKQPRVEISMAVDMRWVVPSKFILNEDWIVAKGDASKEVELQRHREIRMLEAIYPRMTSIPDSPVEPAENVMDSHDNVIPQIPIIPIEECVGNDFTVACGTAVVSSPTEKMCNGLNGSVAGGSELVKQNIKPNVFDESNALNRKLKGSVYQEPSINQSRMLCSNQPNTEPVGVSIQSGSLCHRTSAASGAALSDFATKGLHQQEPLINYSRTMSFNQFPNEYVVVSIESGSLCQQTSAASAAVLSDFATEGLHQREPLVNYSSTMSFNQFPNESVALANRNGSLCHQIHAQPVSMPSNRLHDSNGRNLTSNGCMPINVLLNGDEDQLKYTARGPVNLTNIHCVGNANHNLQTHRSLSTAEAYRPDLAFQPELGMASKTHTWGNEPFQNHGSFRLPIDNCERPVGHADMSRSEKMQLAPVGYRNDFHAPQTHYVNMINSHSAASLYAGYESCGSFVRDGRNRTPFPADNKMGCDLPKSLTLGRGKKLCMYFNTPRGCLKGSNCMFLHQTHDISVNFMAQ